MTTEHTTLAEVIEQDLQGLELPVQLTGSDLTELSYQAVHAAKIQVLKAEAMELPAIIDKDSLEANHKFRMRLVKIRTGIDAARKAITAPMRELKGRVDGYLGTDEDGGLQAQIKALEVPIMAAQRKWDEEQEAIRIAALNAIRERNEGRAKRIIAAGMVFDGMAYVLGDLELFPADLHGRQDDAFEAWYQEVLSPKAEEAAKEAAAEAERVQAKEEAQEEENARQKAEFERQAEERKRMDDERAELDRQKAQLRGQKNRLRAQELLTLGAELNEETGWMEVGLMSCPDPKTLADIKDDAWEVCKGRVREAAIAEIEKRKENERRWKVYEVRQAALRELNVPYDGDSVWTLGEATVIDHQLSTMMEEEWAGVLAAFNVAAERRDTLAQMQVENAALNAMRILETPAQPWPQPNVIDKKKQAMDKLLEDQHNIHEAINDLSIFADPKNWWISGSGSLCFKGQHVALATMTIDEFANRALNVLAIELA